MIGLTSYLEYAKAQNKELSFIEGIVIYDDSQLPIPPVVVFIPAVLNGKEKLETLLEEKLSSPDTRGYIIYFQSLRWILPDLENTVRSLPFIIIHYGGLHKRHKVSYGKFTFDKTLKPDPGNTEDNSVTSVPVVINNKNLFLSVSELPEAIGTPKLFEKIDIDL